MATTYALRNTTDSPVTLSGIETIAASAYFEFYNSSTDVFAGMDAIQQSMTSDATGVNYLLAVGDLAYYEDGVLSTSSAFYTAWAEMYNSWLLVKQACLYASIEDVLEAEADNTFGNKKYAVIGGGAVLHKVDGLWVGDIGVYTNVTNLPATTYLAAGCSATVGTAISGFITYRVKGSVTRTWVSRRDSIDVSSVVGENLFIIAEQTTGAIVDNGFYDASGAFLSNSSYYMSKAYAVTPGELILVRTSLEIAGVQLTYFTAESVWLTTTSPAASTHSNGYIVVPADAAYIRICVNKSLQTDTAFFRVLSGAIASKVKTHYTKLCALGDSITACVALNTDDQWFRVAGTQNGIADFVNLAVGGQNISSIVANQMPNIPSDADVIQLLTGIPDYLYAATEIGFAEDTTSATVYGYLDTLANYLIKNHTTAKIIWCTPTRFPNDTYTNSAGQTLSDYADAVALVARRYGFTLVDFYGGAGAMFANRAYADLYLYDGVHQNAAGSAVMAEFYSEFLRPGASGSSTNSAVVNMRPTILPSIRSTMGMDNKFVLADQTAGNIIDNTLIDLSGTAISTSAFYVSSFVAVTPGTRLAVGAGPNTAIPLVFYNSSLAWIQTMQFSDTKTDGHLTVPANAAYVRMNVEKDYTQRMALYFVYPGTSTVFSKRVERSLMILGDSVAYGTGTNSDNIWWKLAGVDAGFTTLLNYATSGATLMWLNTNSIIYRVYSGDIPRNIADTLLVTGGINDHASNQPLGLPTDNAADFATSFYGSLKFLADMLVERNPYTRIIWVTPTRYLGDTTANAGGYVLADYAKAMAYVAKLYGFSVIDLYHDLGLDTNVAPFVNLFKPDTVYFNIAGHRLIAAVVAPYLKCGGVVHSPSVRDYLLDASGGDISSVFGRTGAVVATSGDYNTSQVTENTNLYFTDARVRSAVLAGLSTASSTDVTATDNVLAAIGKLQAQCDLAARTDTTNTFTAQQTFSAAPVFSSAFAAPAHGTAATPQVVNVCYGTSATAPSGVPEGTLYFQYT